MRISMGAVVPGGTIRPEAGAINARSLMKNRARNAAFVKASVLTVQFMKRTDPTRSTMTTARGADYVRMNVRRMRSGW
jgi:hypothetical protein